MANRYPRLYADDRGVWEEEMSGHSTGIEWGDVSSVVGYKEKGIGGVDEATVTVELEPDYGHDMRLLGDSPGFAEIVEAITNRLPGISAEWFAQIERLQPKDVPVTVWRQDAPEMKGRARRLYADERGVWREDIPGRPFVVEWDEIVAVIGRREFSSDGVVVCVGLDLELVDPPLVLLSDWPGFAEVVEAITNRLPGIPAGWFARITALPPLTTDGPPGAGIELDAPVWRRRRDIPVGYPRLYADDQGVWRELKPGRRFGLEWGEIRAVTCSFWEGTQGETQVSLDLGGDNGDLSVGGPYYHDDPSVPELVAAITARLGMQEGWYAKAKRMKPTRAPLTVWRCPDPAFLLRGDDRGVWRGDNPVAEWGKIVSVFACRRHQLERPEGVLNIELDVANAPRESLYDGQPGFANVVEAITTHLPGIPAGWFAEVERLRPGDEPVVVWRRAYSDGHPRLYADDRGAWREDMPGQAFGVAWDEIDRVRGRKAEGTPGYIEVELARADGSEPLFLQSNWQGYAEVVEAITTRLPHMPVGWPAKLEQLQPGFSIWRCGFVGVERLAPDGTLLIGWQRI